MRKRWLGLTAVLLPLAALATSPAVLAQYSCTGSGNTANCPPCYYNQTPFTTRGESTGDGRAGVNVFIQGGGGSDSWDVSPGVTENHIWGAVETAREKWNSATDTTSDPGTTHSPPYYFRENQGAASPRPTS